MEPHAGKHRARGGWTCYGVGMREPIDAEFRVIERRKEGVFAPGGFLRLLTVVLSTVLLYGLGRLLFWAAEATGLLG